MGICDSSNSKAQGQSKDFYKVARTISERKSDIPDNKKNQIKLEFSIDNCTPGEKYSVMAEFLNSQVIEPFNTEVVTPHQNMVTFNTCYICEYFFEILQLMRITLFKNGKNIGSFSPYLDMIVGSPNSTFRTNLSPDKPEFITISAQGITDCNNLIMLNLMVKSNKNIDFKNNNNKISFMITSNNRKVYKSELISNYGQFKNKSIPKDLLEPQFEISFLNSKGEKIVTKSETPLNFTQHNNQVYLTLSINNNDYYIFNNSESSLQYSFIDYIKNGVQIGLSIGIDFTRSNGEINNPNSLHRIIPGSFNDYEQAIKSCGFIMAFYDYDQLFPVYGFGAIINNNSKNANMCFNVNFQQKPEVHTIDNVIEEYHNCLSKILLYGPTEFAPIIRKEIEIINTEQNPLIYHVLMILTDGVIDDFQQTVDTIIEASFLPFSLIIIGIGSADFGKMVDLDGDKVPLISSSGIRRLRDVVQFVPFNDYRNNTEELTKQVLEEIPTQVVEYYTMSKIYPNNLKSAILKSKTMINMNTI